MNKKRRSIFIVTLLLFTFVLTGCGADAVGLLNHLEKMQEISATKPTQTISRISISDIELPMETIPANQKQIVEAITGFLDDYYITITQTNHPKKNISSMSIDLTEKLNHDLENENLLTINYKDEAFALSTGPKFAELPLQIQAMVDLFTNQLIPLSAFEGLLGEQALVLSSISNREGLVDISNKSMAYLKEFGKIYDTMDTISITKDAAYGGSYVFQMNATEFANFLHEFVSITLGNTDAILGTTINFFDSLTEAEFNLLYGQMFPNGKAEMILLLKEAMETPIPADASQEWKAVYDSEIRPTIINTMEGSSVGMRTWKEDDKYCTNLYGTFKVSIPSQPNMKLASTILIKEELKVISDDFDITMPTSVISEDLIKSILPAQ